MGTGASTARKLTVSLSRQSGKQRCILPYFALPYIQRSTLYDALYLTGGVMIVWRAEDERRTQNVLVKCVTVSLSETSTSGSPTSHNTDATKLRATILAVAALKVWTSHTRLDRRSMCTCRKSWPERATGNLRKSRLIHLPQRVGTSRG